MSTLTSPPPAYSPRPDVTDSSDHDSITLVASDNGSDCPTGSSDAGSVTSCDKKPPKEKPHEQKPSDGKKLREKQPKALETIMEDAAVQTCPNHQPAQKICGRRQCFWMIIVASLLFVIGFVISWTQRQKHADVLNNATGVPNSTVTVSVSSTVTTTQISTTLVYTTRVNQTLLPTTTSATPAPPPALPTINGGFSAADYIDGSVDMYWVDDAGNVYTQSKSLDNSTGWYGNSKIASNARVGTAVSVEYNSWPNDAEHVFYVDQDYILQDIVFEDEDNWYNGSLGSLKLKTSESMNFITCGMIQDPSVEFGAPNILLYYNSSDGEVKQVQGRDNNEIDRGWTVLPDPPFSNRTGFVGCDIDFSNNTIAWIMNKEDEILEQWSFNPNNTDPWTRNFQFKADINPNTLIYSVTSWEVETGRSHLFLQRINNSIIRLDTAGLGKNIAVVGEADLGLALPGSRITASGNCSTELTVYFQDNGTRLVQYSMIDDYSNNEVRLTSSSRTVPNVKLPDGSISSTAHIQSARRSRLLLLLCLVAVLGVCA